MKWSKLKKLVEERVAPSLRKRFAINSTRYGDCTCGHAWITIDKKVVANFCTRAFWLTRPTYDEDRGRWIRGQTPEHLSNETRRFYDEQPVEFGELSRQDAYRSCWAFVHDLSIEESLASDDPLIQSLAVIDSRVGKGRLSRIETKNLHPLAQRMLAVRSDSEIAASRNNSIQGE